MHIETTFGGTILIILAMALVTLVTRWGGVFVMSFIPIGPRVQQFISAMSGSVLVALLAPMAVEGDADLEKTAPCYISRIDSSGFS